MKRFFIVTYFAYFESNLNSKHHSIYRYYIWNAPDFLDWIVEQRKKIEEEQSRDLVIVNCGKF